MRAGLRVVPGLAAIFLLLEGVPAHATVKYRVSLAKPEQHTFAVTMTVAAKDGDVIVALPAWNALYQVRDFAYRVQTPQPVTSALRSQVANYPVEKLDKQTWRLCRCGSAELSGAVLTFRYNIRWDDPGPFNSQLNAHHGFINFAEILMYLPDRRTEDVDVAFADIPAGWRLISELPSGPDPNSFVAASYDALVDAPVEAGKFEEFDFDSAGARFRVAVDAKEYKKPALEDSLRKITAYEMQLMGGAPFKEYTFLFHIGPYAEAGGGGMEHANSTAISSGSVEGAAGIAAHEFFHAWNVKRIRPQSLEPVDYTKEQYTRALWFAEGVTSTYGSYALERSGIWSKAQFFGDLGEQICTLDSRPAHKWQSAEESSLDTWLDKYEDYNRADRSISYYNKGQVVGVLLDLSIRDATGNHKSLDDVLRRLNDLYAKQGKFYDESEGIRSVIEEVTGKSYTQFFARYVSGVAEIPYDELLSPAGLELKKETHEVADLGFTPGRTAAGLGVIAVDAGSNAEAAGLKPGDVLVQLNGEEVTRNLIRGLGPHQPVKLRIRREGQEREISFSLGARQDTRCAVVESPKASAKQIQIREGLLRGTTN